MKFVGHGGSLEINGTTFPIADFTVQTDGCTGDVSVWLHTPIGTLCGIPLIPVSKCPSLVFQSNPGAGLLTGDRNAFVAHYTCLHNKGHRALLIAAALPPELYNAPEFAHPPITPAVCNIAIGLDEGFAEFLWGIRYHLEKADAEERAAWS